MFQQSFALFPIPLFPFSLLHTLHEPLTMMLLFGDNLCVLLILHNRSLITAIVNHYTIPHIKPQVSATSRSGTPHPFVRLAFVCCEKVKCEWKTAICKLQLRESITYIEPFSLYCLQIYVCSTHSHRCHEIIIELSQSIWEDKKMRDPDAETMTSSWNKHGGFKSESLADESSSIEKPFSSWKMIIIHPEIGLNCWRSTENSDSNWFQRRDSSPHLDVALARKGSFFKERTLRLSKVE